LDSWTNKLQRLGHTFTLVSLIFFILAVSAPTITRFDMWNGAPQFNSGIDTTSTTNYTAPIMNDRASDTLGLFYHCEATGSNSKCRFIKVDCSVSKDHSQPAEAAQFIEGLSDCAEFNGIRSTAVLALLFTGVAWLAQHAFIHRPVDRPTKRLGFVSVGIHQLGWIFGLVSMSLALDYFGHLPTPGFGWAFWLLVIAWPLSLLGEIIFFQGVVAEEVAPALYVAEWRAQYHSHWQRWGRWHGHEAEQAKAPAAATAVATAAAVGLAVAAAPATAVVVASAPAQPQAESKVEGKTEVAIEMAAVKTETHA